MHEPEPNVAERPAWVRKAALCAAWIIAAAIALAVVISLPPYMQYLAIRSLLFGAAVMGVHFIYARCGELSFGHGLFFGVGAYTYALGGGSSDMATMAIVVCAGGLIAVVLAVVVAAITYRIRGVYFTIATVCSAETARVACAGAYGLTNGDNGIHGLIAPEALRTPGVAATVIVLFVALMLWLTIRVRGTSWCLRLDAARQSRARATASGLNVRALRFQAVVASAAPAGLAGALWAAYEGSVHPELLGWRTSGDMIAMMLLGGPFHPAGAFLGAGLLGAGRSLIASEWSRWPLLVGATLIGYAVWWPNGVIGQFGSVWRRVRGHSHATCA